MRIAAMGDNCIDDYVRLGRKYPTGNVVDTAVNLKKLGADVSVISTTGNDTNGQWMISTLKEEGLNIDHLHVGEGPTAVTYMDMKGTDRIHGEYAEGVLERMTFGRSDVEFAAEHDLVHTALWGKAERILPELWALGARISFDYADRLDHPLVEETLPYVNIGFFSYPHPRDPFIEEYLKDKVSRGMKIAVATFGEHGSLAWDGIAFYACGIFPAEIVNTVGAGDSFIAGFLYEILNERPIEEALEKGALIASEVIRVFEPWVSEEMVAGGLV